MKKVVIGLAVLAVSTSGALAAHKGHHHAMKPKAAAAAPAAPMMMGNVSAADKALYKKNKHDSGMK
jgi:hypothetical protein